MNENFSKIIESNQLTLVDFYAVWCGPCKMMSPVLKQVKEEVKDSAKIIKVNVDTYPDLASAFMVRGVPTLILFKEGKVLWRQSGVVEASNLIELIHNYQSLV